MELTWLQRWQPQLLALLRIVAGLLFIEHATQKFFAFPVPFPLPGPLPPMLIAAGATGLLRRFLITPGLLTRLAACTAAAAMPVAHFGGPFPKGLRPAANMGGAAVLRCLMLPSP